MERYEYASPFFSNPALVASQCRAVDVCSGRRRSEQRRPNWPQLHNFCRMVRSVGGRRYCFTRANQPMTDRSAQISFCIDGCDFIAPGLQAEA